MSTHSATNSTQSFASSKVCTLLLPFEPTRHRAPPIPADISILNLGERARPLGFYSPADVDEAARLFSANCGPASFAAISRTSVCASMRHFPQFPIRPWTTKVQMKSALESKGWSCRENGKVLPDFGLALLQLTGHWNRIGVHWAERLRRTHWVAVFKGYFYDINWQGWLPVGLWEELVLPGLKRYHRGSDAWTVLDALQVQDCQTAEPFQRSVASVETADNHRRSLTNPKIVG